MNLIQKKNQGSCDLSESDDSDLAFIYLSLIKKKAPESDLVILQILSSESINLNCHNEFLGNIFCCENWNRSKERTYI